MVDGTTLRVSERIIFSTETWRKEMTFRYERIDADGRATDSFFRRLELRVWTAQEVLAGEKAALLATDPPYCVNYTGANRPQNSGKDWSHVYREVDIADLGEFLDGFTFWYFALVGVK